MGPTAYAKVLSIWLEINWSGELVGLRVHRESIAVAWKAATMPATPTTASENRSHLEEECECGMKSTASIPRGPPLWCVRRKATSTKLCWTVTLGTLDPRRFLGSASP